MSIIASILSVVLFFVGFRLYLVERAARRVLKAMEDTQGVSNEALWPEQNRALRELAAAIGGEHDGGDIDGPSAGRYGR